MKFIALFLISLFPLSAISSDLTNKLTGNYVADSKCGERLAGSKVIITESFNEVKQRTYLEVKFLDDRGWIFESSEMALNTKGKTFNCTPPDNHFKIQCRVKETKASITANERSCAIGCTSWRFDGQISIINGSQVSYKSPVVKECILNRAE